MRFRAPVQPGCDGLAKIGFEDRKVNFCQLHNVVGGDVSSTLCMVWPTRPNSATGQMSLMNRASEVPPVVLSSGRRPRVSSQARMIASLRGPGLVTKDSPVTRKLQLVVARIAQMRIEGLPHSSASRLSEVCRSLKRMLKRRVGLRPGSHCWPGCRHRCGDLQGRGLKVFGALDPAARVSARLSIAPGDAPGCRPDADRRCALGPRTTGRRSVLPRRPILIMSPSAFGIGRLADDAGIEALARLVSQSSTLRGAVDGRAFLVAGDQEADRAGRPVRAPAVRSGVAAAL